MALSNNDKLCNGCGSRRGEKHCTYPSNPKVNDTVPQDKKRAPYFMSTECMRRRTRTRAHAIAYKNKTTGLS